ncbi:type II secretion system protein GspL [Enterovibrio nigricans]|uniref:Type II secretion system protein L n=1 Tax=Enterovibrio nigricans DSM 22720 TaxID=1121868 RepID=A0A1T4U9Z6_9GAMM|nr:type II secretion system protein GspL [Enterovibrio nigricans]PKF51403.1 type II secretion system protein GspL [Enterovibrio nigricans]SKA49565.1 general secretion pathway protein L [Enterovibrio nigricans DSM 22720]
MSEILTVRLNGDPNEVIPWLVWSVSQQEVIASGEAESLLQLSDYAKERDVIALADSAAITMTTVTIPSGSERQLDAVLPYLLEDDLAQDVDALHVTLLSKKGSIANVAVIGHSVMQRWLQDLADAGMSVRKIIPDVLCLPLQDDGISAVRFNDRWLLRTSDMEGCAVDEGWLPMWMRSLHDSKDGDDILPVVSYSALPEDAGDNWKSEPAEMVMLLLTQGALLSRFNLLAGKYKPQNQILKHLRPWRGAAIAAGIVLAVLGGEKIAEIYQMEAQTAQIRQQSEARVRALLPQNQRIPTTSYMRRLLENEVGRLSGAGVQTGVMIWLAEIGPLMGRVPSIELDSMRFDQDRGELRLNARGKDFSDFEKLREAFAEDFNTELGQLSRNEQSVTGAFVLKKEP